MDDYTRIAAAIRFLEEPRDAAPSLDEVARHVGLSSFHLQRLFQRWAGISPKRFAQFLALSRAKSLLAASTPVLETAHAVGLSGPGRLHDLFVTLEAVTPGEYRLGGAGVEIRFGRCASPFGCALLAATPRGVCGLAFCDDDQEREAVEELRGHWPRATWTRDDRAIAPLAARIFGGVRAREPLAVVVRGTNFQVQVWEALLRLPPASVTSYEAIATAAGRPAAIRAAAGAVGDNPIAWLIPCHRVLRKSGALGGYRWGLDRKRTMLAWESLHTDSATAR